MKMSSWLIRYILFLFLLVIPGFSGITLYASDFSGTDSSHVDVRLPDPKIIESFKSQKEFNYTKPPLETNFLHQILVYLKNRFGSWEKFTALIPWLFKLFLVVLAVFILIVVITKTKIYQVFYSGREIETPDFELSKSSDERIDFEETIRQQVADRHYRLAVRTLYLKLIVLLRTNEFIHFSKGKTNADYWHDLAGEDFKSQFFSMTSIYNHVWYGDVEIAEEQYLTFEKKFQSFYTAINVQK